MKEVQQPADPMKELHKKIKYAREAAIREKLNYEKAKRAIQQRLGASLLEYRLTNGLALKDVAAELGMSVTHYAEIEKGNRLPGKFK